MGRMRHTLACVTAGAQPFFETIHKIISPWRNEIYVLQGPLQRMSIRFIATGYNASTSENTQLIHHELTRTRHIIYNYMGKMLVLKHIRTKTLEEVDNIISTPGICYNSCRLRGLFSHLKILCLYVVHYNLMYFDELLGWWSLFFVPSYKMYILFACFINHYNRLKCLPPKWCTLCNPS